MTTNTEMPRGVVVLAALMLVAAAAPAYGLELTGSLQWARRVELGTPVSGVIERIPAKAGQQVEEGTGLVYLDRRGLKADLAKAEAEAERLKKSLAEAKRELDRSEQLYARTLLSDHDLELARIDYAAAEAEYASARATLVQARLDLEYSVVRAPFPAIILTVHAEKGQTVVSNLEAEPLVTVAEAGRMVATLPVSEKQFDEVVEGSDATIRLDGREFSGRVTKIGLEPLDDSGVARYPVEVVFAYDTRDGLLRAGRKVKVRLP